MSLWFVTPAWQRYAMTAVCLEQRRRAIAALAEEGVEAHQVVVADDENLDIARSIGADTVECANVDDEGRIILGRRWNVGMTFAAERGAEWIVQIGSDSWIDPAYFLPFLPAKWVLTSPDYCAVQPTRMAHLRVSPHDLRHAAGPYVFHRSRLEPSHFAPCDERSLFTDSSTVAGIERSMHQPIDWRPRTVHPFQYVGFRVEPLMTTYHALTRRWLVREYRNPWPRLARHYPADLVASARSVMESAA